MRKEYNAYFHRTIGEKTDVMIRLIIDANTVADAESKFDEWVKTEPYGKDAKVKLWKIKSAIPRGERLKNVKGKEIKGE